MADGLMIRRTKGDGGLNERTTPGWVEHFTTLCLLGIITKYWLTVILLSFYFIPVCTFPPEGDSSSSPWFRYPGTWMRVHGWPDG